MSDGEGAAEDRGLLREWAEGHQRVTHLELFFDLVYVFAITQLSHLLLGRLTWRAGAEMILLLLAVWWAWVYTAWFTNWLDPDRRAVRLVLLGGMLASLLMAAAIPEAFGDRGLLFAGAFVAFQVGRTGFVVAVTGRDPKLRHVFSRILGWLCVAGVLWLSGALVEGGARWALWIGALVVDYAGPVAGFWTPRLGRSTTDDWQIAGDHLAERCQLFVIVALGESILVTGSTFSDLPSAPEHLAGLVVAFAGSVAMWWIYFDRTATVSSEVIARSTDPGRLGRSAYTYFHLPIVAGIVVAAVADDLVLSEPLGEAAAATIGTVVAGPALFLLGHALFKWAVFQTVTYPRLLGVVLLLALIPVGQVAPPLLLATLSATIVALVAASDVLLAHPQGDLDDHLDVEELELDER